MSGSSAVSLAGIGKPCGHESRAVERDEEAVLDLLRQLVLERGGEAVGLVPGVAEHVGQEPLDDPVPADGGDRGSAADLGELDPPVGPVVDEAAVGQAFQGGGHRARAQAQPFRQRRRCAHRRHETSGRWL